MRSIEVLEPLINFFWFSPPPYIVKILLLFLLLLLLGYLTASLIPVIKKQPPTPPYRTATLIILPIYAGILTGAFQGWLVVSSLNSYASFVTDILAVSFGILLGIIVSFFMFYFLKRQGRRFPDYLLHATVPVAVGTTFLLLWVCVFSGWASNKQGLEPQSQVGNLIFGYSFYLILILIFICIAFSIINIKKASETH